MKRVMNLCCCWSVSVLCIGVLLLYLEATTTVLVVGFVLPAFSSSSSLRRHGNLHGITSSTRLHVSSSTPPSPNSSSSSKKTKESKRVRLLNRLGFRQTSQDNFQMHQSSSALQTNTKSKGSKKTQPKFRINTLEELDAYWKDPERRFRNSNTNSNDKQSENNEEDDINYDALLKSLHVQGDTQIIGSPDHKDYTHPVVKILHERKRRQREQQQQGSNATNSGDDVTVKNGDGCRVALSIEGGGMRGCISAGMVCGPT
jgi:hypothetical protein